MLQEPELNPSKENIYSLQETVPALETNNFAQQEATLAHNEIELIESLSISSLPETNKPKSTWQSINFQSRQITPENLMRTTMVEEENPKTKSEKEEEEKKEEEEFGEVMSSETTGELLLSIDTAYSKEEETSSLVLEEKVFKIETESEFPPVEPQFMVEDSICQQLTTVTEEVHTAKEMGFSFSDITDIGEEGEEGYSKATSSKTSISEEILLEEVSEQFAAENGLEILKIGITIPKHGERRPERLNVDTTVESVNKSIDVPADKNMADFVTPPTPGVPPTFDTSNFNDELDDNDIVNTKELDDSDVSNTNVFSTGNINMKKVKANLLGPRQQEKYDASMPLGVSAFFNNKFLKAKGIFETRAAEDPLYALGLSAMTFIKAITSSNPIDTEVAIKSLTETYEFSSAQIEAASAKKPLKDTMSHYLTNLMGSNPTHLPTNTKPLKQEKLNGQPIFMSNGALRAHVIKAECCLLISVIYMTQETIYGYLKMGLNLRRAYSSYSLVWQEYKRMGQDFNKYMDQDTISAIQFGIGSVHLLLSFLPPKILKIVSAFGWKADKHLGFALLKLCLEGRHIRSPLASLALLAYYVTLTSSAPQILSRELVQPAVECLLDAQKNYPNSSFFLYFAGCVSRLAKNLPLSTQSFTYTHSVSQGGWAEATMGCLSTYEIAFNSAMSLDWASAAAKILEVQDKNVHSSAFIKYFYGTCMDMAGDRTEAILAFANASQAVDKKKKTQMDQYVFRRVEFFEQSGYQDMDLHLPAIEILYLWNSFENMTIEALEICLSKIDVTLERVYEREKHEYELRTFELAPNSPPPDYHEYRAILLIMKASALNSLHRHQEAIVHLNWVIDHKEKIKQALWIVPFAYWESGVTCWGIEDYKRARHLWETAQAYSDYDFEFKLSIRLNLVISHAIELGVPETPPPRAEKGRSTQGHKRMSFVGKLTGTVAVSNE